MAETKTTETPVTEAPKSTAKRDKLRDIEQRMQKLWEENHVYETEAPADWKPGMERDKYLVTFPYPYMNGCLHIGHAFTVTKAEFAARYEKLKGKNALFPFGFHCTGMPIKACADKLRAEIAQYGNPPVFPKEEEKKEEEQKESAEEQKKKAEIAQAEKKANTAGEFHGRKAKVSQKKASVWQWNILRSNGVPESEIAEFVDPQKWLQTFPAQGMKDLKYMGVAVDWRRSFITTDANPFYDSFVRWQFENLRLQDKIAFGKRYTIYSPKDGQACADHERQEGEGVLPQEYTLIKMEVVRGHADVPPALQAVFAARPECHIYLVAGTLRPETMYGQTNCWALPTGEYGVYETAQANELFVCMPRAARNMAYQGLTRENGKVECVATLSGQDLLGTPLRAPLAKYDVVHVLPMASISPEKSTGVVTSVPSDSPDDYTNFMALKNKADFRKKVGVKDEWVLPFEIVPIINIPDIGDVAAETVCQQLKVNGPNDKVHLAEAKEITYQKGFYLGTMIVGAHKGVLVKDAKPLVRDELLKDGQAVMYCEPASRVMSRSGDECVVALCDQWYLKYGEEKWRAATEAHMETMNFYNSAAHDMLKFALGWMNQWACSRNFGLGTRLPWDPKYLIESLSDSTVYMAYYTVAHLLQGNTLDSSQPNALGIKPEQMTTAVWNYVFLNGPLPDPAETGLSQETLDKLRKEFLYWYPLDLRVSGKDLLQNHLLFCLYNHAAIFPDRSPVAFRANGHLLLNGEKMSKSTGNFYTMRQGVDAFGADGMRVALADAGDGIDDANFVSASADSALLRMYTLLQWLEEVLAPGAKGLTDSTELVARDFFHDAVFDNAITAAVNATDAAYARAMYREALVHAMFDLQAARDLYRSACEACHVPMQRALIARFVEVEALMLSPIAPHIADHIWRDVLHRDGFIWRDGKWPTPAAPVDQALLDQSAYIEGLLNVYRTQIQRHCQGGRAKKGKAPAAKNPPPTDAEIVYADQFPEWVTKSYDIVNTMYRAQQPPAFPALKAVSAELAKAQLGANMKKAMSKVAMIQELFAKHGEAALDCRLHFDEAALLTRLLPYIQSSLGLSVLNLVKSEKADERVMPGSPLFNILK